MQIDSYRAGVESAVSRLGVKARAAADLPRVRRARFPTRPVFPMRIAQQSPAIARVLQVGQCRHLGPFPRPKGGGAERLLSKGHLAAILGGGTEPVFAQVPFVSDDDLVRLVEAILQDLDKSS